MNWVLCFSFQLTIKYYIEVVLLTLVVTHKPVLIHYYIKSVSHFFHLQIHLREFLKCLFCQGESKRGDRK